MKLAFVICLPLFISHILHGQESEILDSYIREGLSNNLALQQKTASYNQSLAALKEARGMFMPSISLNARYTVAEGGRTIVFPVGDLLNPVYSTLNALTSSLPPDQQFPPIQIENEE